MAVYVDKPIHRYRRMIMCHMVADTLFELHQMAKAIGVARRHFQNGPRPHYDICKAKRADAVRLGAKETSSKHVVRIARQCATGEAAEILGDIHRRKKPGKDHYYMRAGLTWVIPGGRSV